MRWRLRRSRFGHTARRYMVAIALLATGSVLAFAGYMGAWPIYAHIALPASLIIPGGLIIYMMVINRDVARRLHERLDKQDEILGILKETSESSLEELSSLKALASSQDASLKEMVSILAGSATSWKKMEGTLVRIETKLDTAAAPAVDAHNNHPREAP